MKKQLLVLAGFVPALLLVSCGSSNQSSQQPQNYKDTKAIVLDVLKTEEAQKAIQASQKNDATMMLLSTGQGQQIQLAVKDVLTNTTASQIISKTMMEPKFASDFAKVIEKNNKQLHKELMKDPEYQKSMLDVMNNPEYQKLVMGIMKTAAYRKQMMTVVQESMQSPTFKAQILELLTKAVEEEMKPKEAEMQQTSQKDQDQKKDQKKEGESKEGDSSEGGGGDSEGKESSEGKDSEQDKEKEKE